MGEAVILLLIPVSLFLIVFPFFLARRIAVQAVAFCIITPLAFAFAALLLMFAFEALRYPLGENSIWLPVAVISIAGVLALYLLARNTIKQLQKPSNLHGMLIAGAGAAMLSYALKIAFGGWLIFAELGTGFALATSVFHFELRALSLACHDRRPPMLQMILADILLLLASLLRYDVGDGDGWLTILAIFSGTGGAEAAPPAWLDKLFVEVDFLLYNAVLYLPVAVVWGLMITRLTSREARSVDRPTVQH